MCVIARMGRPRRPEAIPAAAFDGVIRNWGNAACAMDSFEWLMEINHCYFAVTVRWTIDLFVGFLIVSIQ